eukprot:TRINITY_DN307_c0_g1_i3.p1 TRINITY_DN307_c0_g1~~TRINITY_DN307_c0_g1_i3.p1  ORF type:complete len:743 (+),score=133.53 TRINITY_DN307_c0_g1_i3:177-2405(+)
MCIRDRVSTQSTGSLYFIEVIVFIMSSHVVVEKPVCKANTLCPNKSCTLLHDNAKCRYFDNCADQSCTKRHRFHWVGALRVCTAARKCTLRPTQCPYDHGGIEMCPGLNFNECSSMDCPNRHGPDRQIQFRHNQLFIGDFNDGESPAVEALKDQIILLSGSKLKSVVIVDPKANSAPRARAIDSPTEVVVAFVVSKLKGQPNALLRDEAFSCKLVAVPQEDGTTKQVLAFTSYTPNFVDQGITMGTLTSEVLDRASRLFVSRHEHNPTRMWGSWAKKISFSTKHATSAIAATKYFDVAISNVDGVNTLRVVGESVDQPEQSLRIEDVQLSHTTVCTESTSIIAQSMSSDASSITASEYFKLPSSGSRMEYTLVLAGAVAGWCGKKQQADVEPTLPKQPAMLTSHNHVKIHRGRVELSITYGGFENVLSALGRYVHKFAVNFFNKVCQTMIDPSRAVCIVQSVQPNEEQLRQLRTIAGMVEDDTPITYEDVAERLDTLGFATTDVVRSVGCDLSEKHVTTSDSPKGGAVPQCTESTRSFISFYNQFIILDAIDKDGPAAVARNKLLATLSPLPQLLVQWNACRDNASMTDFKCGSAIGQCVAKLVPNVMVPVRAVVVRPPKDGYMTEDGTITVYVPHATPPPCAKSQPVIITIPANCVRDKDGDRYNAFDVKRCAVGRTVMLMVSLYMMPQLTNGMTVPNDGSVTLVPEVPLSLLPKWFDNNCQSTDADYDRMRPAQSISWEE